MHRWLICPALLFAVAMPCVVRAADGLSPKLDVVEFSEAPLVEVVDFLRARSQELDPTGRAANIVIDPTVDAEREVTLALGDVSIGLALLCLVEQCGLDYRREPHAFMILPEGTGTIAREELQQQEPAISPQVELARSLTFERIEFAEAPVSDVLAFLSAKSRENGGAGLNLVVDHRVDPTLPVSLNVSNVTAAFVLGRVAAATGVEVRAVPWAILVEPPGEEFRRQQKLAELARQNRVPYRPPSKRNYLSKTGNTYENQDPRSPTHPDYVHSSHGDVSKRSNALNNVYQWVGGKWTFVRYGGNDREGGLETGNGGLQTGTLGEKR